jgi:hypothetical protein
MDIRWISSKDVVDPTLKAWIGINEAYELSQLIPNVQTDVRCLSVCGKFEFPVTINNTEWDNSYVVSLYNAYVVYAEEELRLKVKSKLIKWLLLPVIKLMGYYFKWCSINRIVHVNNFAFSTNPYPENWEGEYIQDICDFLQKEFPKHLIIFRSVNEFQNKAVLNKAAEYGLTCMLSRQIYIQDETTEQFNKHKNVAIDRKTIQNRGLRHVPHAEMHAYLDQAERLYKMLYLDKYSVHNPQFTKEYFYQCHQQGFIHFEGYIDESGKLKAFAGIFRYADTITTPFLGYDSGEGKKSGLYVHAAYLSFDYKFKTQLPFNCSSGAPQFKKWRGAKPVWEYSIIAQRHLKVTTRFAINVLTILSNNIGKYILHKYEL